MKTAAATIALCILSLGGISCSHLATTGKTQPGDYTTSGSNQGYAGTDAYGQTGQTAQTGQPTQGGYYGSTGGYDQAQVYPQQGQSPQAQAGQAGSGQYQTPTYQSPAPLTYSPAAQAPAYTPPAYTGTAATGGQPYTVQKGDNLYRISQTHGTSVANIMSLNGLASDVIHPGDVLTVR
jgi:LysM repeat protein